MRTKAVICGAGGLSKEIYYLLQRLNSWDVIAFLDKDNSKKEMLGIPIYTDDFLFQEHHEKIAVIFGLQSSQVKRKIYEKTKRNHNIFFPAVISPTAHISPATSIGDAVVITDNCWISNNVTIGIGVLIDIASMIGHDVVIGDYSSIMPMSSISGNVIIGENTFIGGKSFIRQELTIGSNVVIGAGSVVVSGVDDNLTVVGNPARVLKKS